MYEFANVVLPQHQRQFVGNDLFGFKHFCHSEIWQVRSFQFLGLGTLLLNGPPQGLWVEGNQSAVPAFLFFLIRAARCRGCAVLRAFPESPS
jgi:hypothetical protein